MLLQQLLLLNECRLPLDKLFLFALLLLLYMLLLLDVRCRILRRVVSIHELVQLLCPLREFGDVLSQFPQRLLLMLLLMLILMPRMMLVFSISDTISLHYCPAASAQLRSRHLRGAVAT